MRLGVRQWPVGPRNLLVGLAILALCGADAMAQQPVPAPAQPQRPAAPQQRSSPGAAQAQPAAPAAPAAPAQAPAAAAPAQQAAAIDGFRSAKFGMSEDEVRRAAKRDFPNLQDNDIRRDVNQIERTTSLTARVVDLLPDSGPSQISYIFGFRSKKLVQVNIAWVTAEGATREPLQAAAVILQNYFAQQTFKPDSVVVNGRTTGGDVVVFRGADDKGRTVLLLGRAPEPPEPPAGQPRAPLPAASLLLSYVENPSQPDIFRVQPGQF